jgi:hypothetical protein
MHTGSIRTTMTIDTTATGKRSTVQTITTKIARKTIHTSVTRATRTTYKSNMNSKRSMHPLPQDGAIILTQTAPQSRMMLLHLVQQS